VNAELIIGDGAVFSTAFGSTGYFKSITRKSFNTGYSMALNNTTNEQDPLFFNDGDTLSIKIVRGPATLSEDNNPAIYDLENETEIEVYPSKEKAQIYELNTLRCTQCKVIREKH
jgi:NAD kinase